ncbi:MAG TPA: AtpZ/AtpI family protein [Patescibacteria group bacterium]|nr:AtpZ/AtpI family protein [Patescibacteria group bacterium]
MVRYTGLMHAPKDPGLGPQKPFPIRNASLARVFALVIELPFVFVAAVVVGGAIGYWLDLRLHTSPLFLLILGALGLVAGVRELVRRLSQSGTTRGR